MFKISSDYVIEMIDGDTGTLKINFNNYELQVGDIIYLSVSNPQIAKTRLMTSGDYLFQIMYEVAEPSNSATLIIEPMDTKGFSGEYQYDVQLTTVGGYVDTIIPPNKFIIKRGVTNE